MRGNPSSYMTKRIRLVFRYDRNITISPLLQSLLVWSLSELKMFQRLYEFPLLV